jgi:uncharacterized damage-inducible protein DinB
MMNSVDSVASDVSRMLVRELETLQREISLFPDDESVWTTVPGVTNSAGNLALHVAGNLRHFVGATLGQTGYARDRPAEFSSRAGTRADVVAALQSAIDDVQAALSHISAERWQAEYPVAVNGVHASTALYVLHFSTHAAFHLGQVDYLRRVVTGENRTAGAVDVQALA